MACGLPVIITPHCHLPEVSEWNAGLIVDTDPQEISQAMITMLQDNKMRQAMGQNAKSLVGERFTWKRVAEMTSELLLDLTK
ncbi:MAG: glycosyltransferase [Desulfobacca sp.]|nr:glycosyltransferase [Desulfobacca sp.]